MKANLTLAGGRLNFEIEGESVKDVFERVSAVQEIFEAESTCGCCEGNDIRFLARQVDDYKFYELACMSVGCRARFAFGQMKKGGALYPRRKDEDGNWLPNRGWSKFVPKGEAVANGPVAAPQQAKPAPIKQEAAKQDGIHVFLSWQDAQNSPHWAEPWLLVAGIKYKLVEGQYRKAAA